jgi:hypothetical protein
MVRTVCNGVIEAIDSIHRLNKKNARNQEHKDEAEIGIFDS